MSADTTGRGLSRVRRNQENFGLYQHGWRTDDRLMDANTNDVIPRLGREFIQDPYSLYRRLRASGPAHPVTIWHGDRVWLVSRYAEAKSLLSDRRLSKRRSSIEAQFAPGTAGPVASPLFANMLFSDPPDHTRLRKIVTATGAFTGASIAQWRPKIVRIADELLDRIAGHAEGGTVDLMTAYCRTTSHSCDWRVARSACRRSRRVSQLCGTVHNRHRCGRVGDGEFGAHQPVDEAHRPEAANSLERSIVSTRRSQRRWRSPL